MDCFKGAAVAVTGAGGSIGSELCRHIAMAGARRLVLISLTENGLYQIERKLRAEFPALELAGVLGSVEDGALMRHCLAGVHVVIHAAAHKHVPICEANPCAAIRNNGHGTWSVLEAASHVSAALFVLISSDKAVHPASIMGATKRLAEVIVRDHHDLKMRRVVVRFGNVLDSAGSVLPLWREQIAKGGPVTVTHPDCTRYFMSIQQACFLVGAVCGISAPHAATYVFNMGEPQRLIDMARVLIAESGHEIEIKLTGLRPGEKLEEELHHGGLLESVLPGVFRVVDVMPTIDADQLALLNRLACSGFEDDARNARALLWQLVGSHENVEARSA